MENAYFTVLPPEGEWTLAQQLNPLHEYLKEKLISTENRLSAFRKIDWNDQELLGKTFFKIQIFIYFRLCFEIAF